MSSLPRPTIPLPVRSNFTWIIAFLTCMAILAAALWGLEVFILDDHGAQRLCNNAKPSSGRHSGFGSLISILMACLIPPKQLGLIVWSLCTVTLWAVWRALQRLFDGIPLLMFDERSLLIFGWSPTVWSGLNWFEIHWTDITGVEGIQVWNRGNLFMSRYTFWLLISARGRPAKASIHEKFLKNAYGKAMLEYLAARRPDLLGELNAALTTKPASKSLLFRRANTTK
jgi:hypothetical protein